MGFKKIGLICVASLALVACEQAPEGQVVAIVDGEEITLPEVNLEISQMRLPQDFDPKQAQQIALQRVIDRRLLAQAARAEGLDQTPEFFIQQRQMVDNMLIEQLREKLQGAIPVPSDSEISEYARKHPEAFENRKLLTVDQIVFPVVADSARMAALADDHSMDEVAETLTGLGINFQRRQTELDTGMLGAARLQQIRALPPGEPFILPGPQLTTVAVILGERDAPRTADGARSAVSDQMGREELAKLLETRLENLKQSTEIEYQKGFEPPKKPADKPAE